MTTTIYHALCACLGLSPASSEASVLIREAYQEPENAPQPPRTADVIYYSVTPDLYAAEPPAAYAEENPSLSSHIPAVTMFTAWNLLLVCYGPHAADYARRIRALIFIDGAGMPRSILRKAGLYPLPCPAEPAVGHEPEGSLWRLRADLTIPLRREEKETHPGRRGAVSVIPAVRIRSRK